METVSRTGYDSLKTINKPSFRTSRRNFLAGARTLAVAGMAFGAGLRGEAAQAMGSNRHHRNHAISTASTSEGFGHGEQTGAMASPFAPIASFNGGRSELKSRMRSAVAPLIDRRQPVDIIRDALEERASRLRAAA